MKAKRVAVWVFAGAILLSMPVQVAGGEPTTEPSQRADETSTVPVVGYIIDPPAKDYRPKVTSGEAVDLAKSYEDASKATKISPLLGLLTTPNIRPVTNEREEPPRVIGPPLYQKVPVWLVTIEGVCIPILGGFHRTAYFDQCGLAATVVVDAETAEILMEYI